MTWRKMINKEICLLWDATDEDFSQHLFDVGIMVQFGLKLYKFEDDCLWVRE